MKYQITHETEYDYSVPVTISQHLIHLEPRPCQRQKWLEHHLEITPKPAYQLAREDIFGNTVTAFSLEDEHNVFKVTAKGIAEVYDSIFPEKYPTCCDVRQRMIKPQNAEDIRSAMFLYQSPLVVFDDAVKYYASDCFEDNKSFFDAVNDLNHKIFQDFKYSPGYTKIGTMPSEILRERKGVCQDFAHFMIACLRSLGYSAAYISGYLHTRKQGEQQFLGADATHAWVSVYFPDIGYLEFDPTNNCLAGKEHIIVSKGRDFGDVSPLKGVITGGGPHTLKVAVNVKQID